MPMEPTLENVYIRHPIQNKEFLNAAKQNLIFAIEREADRWKITFVSVDPAQAKELAAASREFNIYAVGTGADGGRRKWWYYDQKEADVRFDAESGELVICADSRMEYPVD